MSFENFFSKDSPDKKHIPLMPVVTLTADDQWHDLVALLLEHSIDCIEITLRTPFGLPSIEKIRQRYPQCWVGAGTVRTPEQASAAAKAGAQFLVSPGWEENLEDAVQKTQLPWMPGIATVTELMNCLQHGWHYLKFFPAEFSGGTNALKAFSSVCPEAHFCPTGGIGLNQIAHYLSIPEVFAVGSSGLVPVEALKQNNWQDIVKAIQQWKLAVQVS
ncbi:MAG: bifunctional 4-hydroxy-2-oxoglutarate aldolase/2-dehydro-3-deoxy-phosphogluconate aldolase [Pseudomonadota bacterium]